MPTNVPFTTRRSVNPILSDREVFDDDSGDTGAFLTPTARWLERYLELITAGLAGAFLLVAWLTEKFDSPGPLTHLLILAAFLLGGIPGIQSAWSSLRERRLDIDVLMVLGAGLAALIGQPIEGALLLFLFSLSGALEEEATRRTHTAIRSLRQLNPTEAIVLEDDGTQQTVLTRHISIGAHVIVRPGDRVPLDGAVLEGESSVDEAPITGESMPQAKRRGDTVFAGTINGEGRLVIEVTKVAGETQLARIIRMVTQARAEKPKVQRLFDRISPTYAASVIGISVAFALLAPLLTSLSWRESLYRAIALLIVASPCALIIATPTAYLSAIASAARRGVLIKGGVYLELLARSRCMVFDKTGTLTRGEAALLRVTPQDGLGEDQALRAAGALEASSSHPLATAISRALKGRGLATPPVSGVELVPGRGVRGRVDGRAVALGKLEWAEELLPPTNRQAVSELAASVRAAGRTAAVLAMNGHAAVFEFEDPLRDDARETLRRLRSMGITQLAMLTGDHAEVARRTAATLELDEFHADLLPEHKIERALSLRRGDSPLVMVGDGVNDAPALARADVGIAMASIGADAALEAAPIVLMSNRLESLGWVVGHARRTARVVQQNLAFAIGVILVLSLFAVAGGIGLPVAVIGHEGSTLVVALNALRLLRA
ncbi:MAG: ATPase [Phycisphaerae bacterium]